MTLIRGLDLLIAELDSRQRQQPPSRNRALQKIVTVADTVGLGQDTQTVTTFAPPYQWWASTGTSVGGTSELAWVLGEWA